MRLQPAFAHSSKVWDTSHVAQSYMQPHPVNMACFMESAPPFAILSSINYKKENLKNRVLLHVFS